MMVPGFNIGPEVNACGVAKASLGAASNWDRAWAAAVAAITTAAPSASFSHPRQEVLFAVTMSPFGPASKTRPDGAFEVAGSRKPASLGCFPPATGRPKVGAVRASEQGIAAATRKNSRTACFHRCHGCTDRVSGR
ncbi:hypothetical protein GCM10007904_25410 [Oharaeibacter diazotrophicus]|nr:hypothetical protein GCM10007904_25410 [Oharaeibacter diazotrophicus]